MTVGRAPETDHRHCDRQHRGRRKGLADRGERIDHRPEIAPGRAGHEDRQRRRRPVLAARLAAATSPSCDRNSARKLLAVVDDRLDTRKRPVQKRPQRSPCRRQQRGEEQRRPRGAGLPQQIPARAARPPHQIGEGDDPDPAALGVGRPAAGRCGAPSSPTSASAQRGVERQRLAFGGLAAAQAARRSCAPTAA